MFVGSVVSISVFIIFTVVVELEVSNRNPKAMRSNYATYFDEDSMICVIGIKLFGNSKLRILVTNLRFC